MSPTCAVVIPVYKKTMDRLEILSLKQCLKVLPHVPLVFVGPESLDFGPYKEFAPIANLERFDDDYFASLEGYSRLLLHASFYEAFQSFDFILIYQLDAFVFENQLEFWCQQPYDYIGAPWWSEEKGWWGVGNGGFSLRRVKKHFNLLKTRQKEDAQAYWQYICTNVESFWSRIARYPQKVLKTLGIGAGVESFITKFIEKGCPEDMFWGLHARRFCSDFSVAPPEVALGFSIEGGLSEAVSRYCSHPPFGCHREWFLEMIERYFDSGAVPRNQTESQVWLLMSMCK